jgi:DNA invertase Pin-like site-specific DNA recombinase
VHVNGQRIGYRRVSTQGQSTERQLEGLQLDEVFEDTASGKDAKRPQLEAMLKHARKGDHILCHSMDRMARNLDDLRAIVLGLTSKGIRVEFMKEGLTFTGDDNAMAKLLLSMMGAFAEFERALILERQREGIAIAKAAGKYKGRKAKLGADRAEELRKRAASGESRTKLAKEYGLSRETLYQYIRQGSGASVAA